MPGRRRLTSNARRCPPTSCDEVIEAAGQVLTLAGMHLVPQVPGEDGAVAAPALAGEGQAVLDAGPCGGAGEQPLAAVARPAIGAVVGMPVPVVPGEEGIARGQQQAQAHLPAQADQIVEHLHHRRHEAADRALQERGVVLAVLQHQPEHRNARCPERGQVPLDRAQVAAATQPLELGPGQRVVLADGCPGLACLVHEVRGTLGHPDPGQPGRVRPGHGAGGQKRLAAIECLHGSSCWRDPE